MDTRQIKEIIDNTLSSYEHRRVEELLSTAKGSSRIDKEDIPSILAKAQSAREIKSYLYTAFNL